MFSTAVFGEDTNKARWTNSDEVEQKENQIEQQSAEKKQQLEQWEQDQKNKLRTNTVTKNKKKWYKHQQKRLKREANQSQL